jgi:hypothetical protein
LPIRCMSCNERAFIPLSQFLKLRNTLKVRHQSFSPSAVREEP